MPYNTSHQSMLILSVVLCFVLSLSPALTKPCLLHTFFHASSICGRLFSVSLLLMYLLIFIRVVSLASGAFVRLVQCQHSNPEGHDVMAGMRFLRHWAFVKGILWLPVDSPSQSDSNSKLRCFFDVNSTNRWANTRMAGDLARHDAHVMSLWWYRIIWPVTDHSKIRQITNPVYICWDVLYTHDDVIKWKHFQRYWTFVRGIHRPPVNSPHKGQ